MESIPSQQLISIIIKAQDQASATAEKVNQNLTKIGNTVGGMISKVPGLGTIGTKLGNVGSTIKSKLEGPLTSARQKLQNLANGATGFGAVLGPLKGALSMTAGMIGYDLFNGLVQAARASINAASQLDYFGKRLNMSASETKNFRTDIDGLQKEFRKVDMTAVGATAEEMAVKFNLPKKSLGDLTRMTAVLSSTFVKEGRTQEDAILAVSDALDGQFKRLQEIGITQDTLKANGWNGNLEDQDSLIKALNKSMQEMGYEQTAKDITNLDEAWGALTIAGGQLLQKVLVPITPAIIQIIDAILKVTDAVGPMIDMFVSAIGNMPDWAKAALGVGALVVAVQLVSTWISATLIPSLAAATLAALDFAAAMLANPLTWVVIALAAVALAIYEVGKAFGWWTDVNSMLSAIWAGIQRLWSAFINHPDVQAMISAISQAWNMLSSAIGGVINWLGSFFTISSGGEFDVVRALITGISAAWQGMTFPIRTVINILMWLKNVFVQVASGQLTLSSAINSIWIAIQTFLSGMLTRIAVRILQWGTQIYTYAVNAARRFVTGIINYIKGLPGKILGYLLKTGSNIRKQGNNWVKNAKTKASQVVSGTVSYMRGLPGKVGTYVSNTATKISTGAQKWVTNATNKASKVVSGVIGYVNDLPGKVATEISNTASRMLDAGSALITNAKNIGKNIVKGLLDSMKIHSPGEIQTKVIKEFEDTVSNIGNMTGTAYKTGASFGSALVDGFGDPSLNPGIEALNVFSEQPTQKLEVHYTHDYNFEGLPDTVSAKEVASMINDAAVNDEWTKKLTSNPRFQLFDSKEKARLNRRQARSRGV